jgi:diaminohydroxyphosphoribosylaminopyrimidine deaminase/5-amino-6-(5-phosphoribosylamino)uracil reductase
MMIGGNTVRVDRPTLDCRFTGDVAPDILVYSKEDNFDRAIPLFSVEGREVEVASSFDFSKPSFVLVEGGGGMMNALLGQIDWLLQYQAPKLSTHDSCYAMDLALDFLFQEQKGVDLMLWSRVKS